METGFDSYVFFTLSGKEEDLAEELNARYEDICCLVLKRMVHRSDHGRKWDEEAVLIKGYSLSMCLKTTIYAIYVPITIPSRS